MTAPTVDLAAPVWLVPHLQLALGYETARAARAAVRDLDLPHVHVGKRLVMLRASVLARLAELEQGGAS